MTGRFRSGAQSSGPGRSPARPGPQETPAQSVVARMRRRRSIRLAGLLALAIAAPSAAAPPVVAIIGEDDGFNPLHQEFRASDPVVYPAGMPTPTFIDLPQGGTFA